MSEWPYQEHRPSPAERASPGQSPPVHVAEQELVDGQLLRGVQEVVPEGSLHRASSVSQLRGKRRE